MLTLEQALQLVLSLARQNVCDDVEDFEEYLLQVEACDVVEKHIDNQLGE